MPCEHPITAYRPSKGGPVSFKRPQHTTYEELQLPCGQCILCRQESARQWAVRITHEASLWEQNCFVTLTYDETNLPKDGNLRYRDLQLFWKKLRKEIGELRYYAVGEYGDKTNRPHYHACIFGHAFTKHRVILRTEPTLLWTSPQLAETWGLGHVSVGALNFQTAMYTAAYVTKKLGYNKRYMQLDPETGELEEMIQPKAMMSLRPAIGREWLQKYGHQVYAFDEVIVDGRKQKPPKYYDRWLKQRSEIAEQMIKEERKKKAIKQTPQQTHARAENARARARQKKKTV
ncbi:MAG: replication initiator protein [Microviridae sp.]|nr:MAG: replication initiator protein [Microviridae sp.]